MEPDPTVLDRWKPGMGIGMVCGHGLDVLDVDMQHDGDKRFAEVEQLWPIVYAKVATPSGGWHDYITSLGIAKDNSGKVAPGIDLPAGRPDRTGRAFVWLPPTEGIPKGSSDELRPYTWAEPPDFDRIEAEARDDTSGQALAEHIAAKRAKPSRQDGESTKGRLDVKAIFRGIPAGQRPGAVGV